jgi:Protein of unknown function (DUF2924)
MMARAVAYRIQEIAFGDVSKATRRQLAGLAGSIQGERQIAQPPRPRIKPGTRLVREWHGRTNEVRAVEDGFEFGGKTYRSLSTVAREITGARWSGRDSSD